MNTKNFFVWLAAVLVGFNSTAQGVTVSQNDKQVTLANGIVSLTFDRNDANLSGIVFRGKELLRGKNQRGYLLGPGFSMAPSTWKVVRQTPDLAEVSFYHEASNRFQYDLRYVLKKNDPGVYCYLVQSHRATDSAGNFGQTRWGIRSDESLFDYHLVRDSIQGPMPKMAEMGEEVQDWTYKMADGTIYTKYNYADYIEDRYVHGMAGQQSGLGMFVIQPSHEYLNGGPTKQYQNVHSNPYLICMFNCGHFQSDKRKGDNLVTGDWVKLNGPFLLYFNSGKDTAEIWRDAKRRAEREREQWPYAWMQHEAYPLARGSVKGTLLLDGKPAVNATVVLAQPHIDWQAQTQKYIYSVRTNSKGEFKLENVRPDQYALYAYGCNSTDEFRQVGIAVAEEKTTHLGGLNWTTTKAGNLLWQIGIADRKTTGFTLSDHKREYGLFNLSPADLNFVIGKSETKDWYYAQTKRGSWDVLFELNRVYNGQALLTIGIAGSAKNPSLEVWVNETKVGTYNFGNDASVYRSAVAGGYYFKQTVPFPSSLLKQGTNTVSFRLPNVKDGGGIMYDVIKLEAN